MRIQLKEQLKHLLIEVAIKHGFDKKKIDKASGEIELSPEDARLLIDILSKEFCATGLLVSDEPNAHGRELENLIDILNRENIK